MLKSKSKNTTASKNVLLDLQESSKATKSANESLEGFQTAPNFMEKDLSKVEWIAEGILPQGVVLLVSSIREKSLLAMEFAVSIATGTKALNEFKTVKGLALYLNYDNSEGRLFQRLNMLKTSNWKASKNLIIPSEYDMDEITYGGIGAIHNLIKEYPDSKLIVVDSLGASFGTPTECNDNGIIQALQDVAIKNDLTILVLDDARNSNDEKYLVEQGESDSIDTLMLLKDVGEKIKLFITERNIIESSYTVKFNNSDLIWEVVSIDEKNDSYITSERSCTKQ